MGRDKDYDRIYRRAQRARRGLIDGPREMCPFCLEWFRLEPQHETVCTQRLLMARVVR